MCASGISRTCCEPRCGRTSPNCWRSSRSWIPGSHASRTSGESCSDQSRGVGNLQTARASTARVLAMGRILEEMQMVRDVAARGPHCRARGAGRRAARSRAGSSCRCAPEPTAQGDEGEEGREEIVNQVLQQPVIQIALPIIITIIVAAWMNNKGIDGVHKRLDDICRRLDAIEARLLGIENRLGTLERKVDALEIKAWR